MSNDTIESIVTRNESDRRYAVNLLMHIDSAGPHTSKYLQGNWCDSIIGSLLRDGLVEIREKIYGGEFSPGDPRIGFFYTSTEKGKACIKHIVKKAFEEVQYEEFDPETL